MQVAHPQQEPAMSQVRSPQQPDTATTLPTAALSRRERDASELWPHDLLEAFCLRMSSRGMCVSRALMQHDRRYGLEQLSHAHNMADDTLRMMAVQLFRHFEARQSGVWGPH
jgi:hypothetical protein